MTFKKKLWGPVLMSSLLVIFIDLYPEISFAESKAKVGKAEKSEELAEPAEKPPAEDPLEPGAEYQCESEISYIWTKISVVRKKDTKSGKEETAFEAGVTDEEFFATVGETGQVKTEVAHRLNVKLPSIQDEAMNHCRQTHQNLTGCTGSGLDISINDYSAMDFELRKKLLASIKERCDNVFGLCIDTRSTPVKCHISRSPDVKKGELDTKSNPAKAPEKGKTKEKSGTKK
jgi:hypothetical protein